MGGVAQEGDGDGPPRRVGPLETVARCCEKIVRITGRICAWLLVLLALVIVLQVFLRYAFDRPLNVLGELQWHLYALVAVFGLSYTMAERAHVRVDIFYDRFPKRLARWIDALGFVLLVIPLGIFLFVEGIKFVIPAFEIGESSPEPDGLPFRWLIKAVIPAGALVLVIEALARLVLVFRGGGVGEKDSVEGVRS